VTTTATRPGRLRAFERRPFAIFASAGDEERRRRIADIATLVTAVALVFVGVRERSDPEAFGASFARLLHDLPDWSKSILGGLFILASIYVVFVLVMAIAARDRPGLVRDLLIAGLLSVVAGVVVGRAVTGEWPVFQAAFNGSGPHFPVLRVVVVTAIAMTAGPHVVRPMRRLGAFVIVSAALASVALEFGAIADVIAGFGIGLGAAAIVRLVFGSPAGAPSLYRVRSTLQQLGIEVGEFTPVPSERGLVELRCVDAGGRPLDVKVYGRDAADAQLVAKAWRFVWYRRGGASLTITRAQQVEHEALVTLLAQRGGVRTADLVATAATANGDKLLITDIVAAEIAEIGSEHLDALWIQLDRLRDARLAHGRIDGTNVQLAADGTVAVDDWSTATIEAPPERIARDVAAGLALSAAIAGNDRAIELAQAHAGNDGLIAAISYLQKPALSPDLRRTVKAAKVNLETLRDAAAAATGSPVPQLVKLERVKWTSLVMMAVLLAAVWFVIGQIADIGWSTIQETFRNATWGWVAVALVVGQTPRFADAISVLGACDQPLAYGPTVALQMSISFINLAIPSTAARVALEVRFFQKQGVAAAKAVTFGALDSFSLFLTQLAILIVTVGFGLTSLDFTLDGEDVSGAAKLAVLAIVAVVIGLIVVASVRRLREFVFHQIAQARDALRGIGSINRWGLLFGGNLLAQILFSTTLGLCVLAFGYHVSLVNLMAVNVMVSFFAGLMPVPGGIGVTEAALTAGLVAAGVPQAQALGAVLTYRFVTYYLPPVWGFFTLAWLRNHDYL
jgi:uncharacterized membrane protein YbhN (UPF0104 family)